MPEVVIEVVSNYEGGEDTEKLALYAQIGVRYYAIYDWDRLLSDETLRAFRLEGEAYEPMREPVWFPEVGLGLRVVDGRYEDMEAAWLRWVDSRGELVPTGRELAEAARQRADRLAEQLRQLGIKPQDG